MLLVLIAVIFALKVAATFSRGATFTFFVLGLGGMIAWRALVAQFLKHALSAGGFASRRVILIGEKSRLANLAPNVGIATMRLHTDPNVRDW